MPHNRTSDSRSSSLRQSLLAPFTKFNARSLTLRLSLTLFPDIVELASLVTET